MKPTFQKGKLISWDDQTGCGYIQPEKGQTQVLLLINDLQNLSQTSHRPQIGDLILYEKVLEPNGKIRAGRASIVGLKSPKARPKQPQTKNRFVDTLWGFVILAIIAILARQLNQDPVSPTTTSTSQSDCVIKGNISIETGNKLYHLPGMEDYEITVINLTTGERWFCTEAEAIANGWQKAPR